jgi:hypothetical protein
MLSTRRSITWQITTRRTVMRRFATAILSSLAICSPIYAADYRFVQIDVPDAVMTKAYAINARGHIGGIYVDSAGVSHSFLLRNGVFETIDVPRAAVTLAVRGINARGDIAGNINDSKTRFHGYLRVDGKFRQIDYPGSTHTFVYSINNAGDIGGEFLNAEGNLSAYIFKNGNFYEVSVPGESFQANVHSVQDNGRVLVGGVFLSSDGGGHGFMRSRPGEFEIVDFPGQSAPCSLVEFINERGEMVGSFSDVDTVEECDHPPNSHGYLLRNGKFSVIDFPGAAATELHAINNYSTIVGEFTDANGTIHGFKAVPRK